MATAPKFNTPKTSPPASGWQPGHRPPAMGYGQLDGNAYGDDKYDKVSSTERDAFPDCDSEGY
jgi:hypothetical protein